jgi:NADH:ubiquinone oxidoreductase subunit 5 (subunit L)/multisubunit Na+/H+ antiporter MnhA subunit
MKNKSLINQTIITLLGIASFAGVLALFMRLDPFTLRSFSFNLLYLDQLSIIMFSFISFIGLAVYRFSLRYLKGEKRQKQFLLALTGAILSAQLLVLSGNLIVFALAWILISLCLHSLLSYYQERPRAILAARKKFLISRLGDLALFFSLAILYLEFQTLDIQALFQIAARALTESEATAINLACLGFVLAACCKSAQLPFHSWLPDTLECPTPVSALMHAGIINGGGYLLIRLNPLLAHSVTSQNLLILIGTLTAVFGIIVMWTQTTVKKSLAWSTVAQMGFMILECGLGAYTLALIHILGHGFYKANAFLLSGTTEKFILPKTTEIPQLAALVVAIDLTYRSLTGGSIINLPPIALFCLALLTILSVAINLISHQKMIRALQIHAINGFYLGIYADRLTMLLWPQKNFSLKIQRN